MFFRFVSTVSEAIHDNDAGFLKSCLIILTAFLVFTFGIFADCAIFVFALRVMGVLNG